MPPREVAVILNLNNDYDRKMAAGISRYAHVGRNWRIYLEDELADRMPDFRRWRGHGVIADLDDEQVRQTVQRLGLPCVGVGGAVTSAEFVPPGVAYVACDHVRIAQLAAEHLLERGLRHFAFCGIPHTPRKSWVRARAEAFRACLAAAGFPCPVFHGRHRRTWRWEALLDELALWLRALPRPVGLMACNDGRARHVLLACRRAGLGVPEDVAVVGVDNDEIMCEMVEPTITSVEPGAAQIGHEAAALLDRMMLSRRQQPPFRSIPPLGIVTRRSTDILCVHDAAVAEGLRFIRDHVGEPIQAEAVARHVRLSRGMLDIRFRRVVGHSVYAEISRARLSAVRGLLSASDLPLKAIAARTGFTCVEYLVTAFRRWTGQTPGEYRKACRSQSR